MLNSQFIEQNKQEQYKRVYEIIFRNKKKVNNIIVVLALSAFS